MEATLKKFDTEFKAVKAEDGTYDITLSVPVEDRDGEIIDAKAFEPLPGWLNIDIDHGMSVLTTVGSGTPAYEGDILKLQSFSFASTALGQEVKTLVDEGHVRKMSVAYMGSKYEDDEDGKAHLRKAELLNAAIVAIPSNREADILAAKAFDSRRVGKQPNSEISTALRNAGRERFGAEETYVYAEDFDSDEGWVIFCVYSDAEPERLVRVDFTREGDALTLGTDESDVERTVAYRPKSAKAAETKTGARNSNKDSERLQSIHDLAVDNGATCSTTTDPDEDAAKAASRPADVDVALAELTLVEAELAL